MHWFNKLLAVACQAESEDNLPQSRCFGLASWLMAFVVAVAVLCLPAALPATTFPQFDRLNDEAQAEYLAVMVDKMEQALRHAGHGDLAGQVEKLFTTVEPGDSMTLGMVELERNVARARLFDAEDYAKDHKAERSDVEDALFVTLDKNKIMLTSDEMNEVIDTMGGFRSKTYAEFEALRPLDQRRLINLCANLGFFSLSLRTTIEDKQQGKKTNLDQDKGLSQIERRVIDAEFLAPDGPGFAKVAQEIAAAYAKTPNDPGVLFTVTQFILTEADNQVRAKMKQMDDSTYHLPDSRR